MAVVHQPGSCLNCGAPTPLAAYTYCESCNLREAVKGGYVTEGDEEVASLTRQQRRRLFANKAKRDAKREAKRIARGLPERI